MKVILRHDHENTRSYRRRTNGYEFICIATDNLIDHVAEIEISWTVADDGTVTDHVGNEIEVSDDYIYEGDYTYYLINVYELTEPQRTAILIDADESDRISIFNYLID